MMTDLACTELARIHDVLRRIRTVRLAVYEKSSLHTEGEGSVHISEQGGCIDFAETLLCGGKRAFDSKRWQFGDTAMTFCRIRTAVLLRTGRIGLAAAKRIPVRARLLPRRTLLRRAEYLSDGAYSRQK